MLVDVKLSAEICKPEMHLLNLQLHHVMWS